ncbi:MAG TPA: N-acetylmuramic acid 6-phosphate etherase [Selenomonadales bacterium]|nr:N-acetylmuramic acid 6-phosphate etherase [Selenomonadales bacterium]
MNLEKLLTEARNPATTDIDTLSTLEIVTEINREDQAVAGAVAKELPNVAKAVDWIVASISRGGRLIYLGAGTSGRLGILDASECPPTYGTPPELVQGLIAGGPEAVFRSIEGAEDCLTQAAEDLKGKQLSAADTVVGIAASGRTPYVIGGLQYAKTIGCKTVAVTCSPDSEMERTADLTICARVGPEVIMGSTRMKAGTAQKLILNMLTTAAMIRSGKVYSNLMVDVQATNSKLVERGKRIVMLAAGVDRRQAEKTLGAAGGSVKVAVTALLGNMSIEEAKAALAAADGFVAKALAGRAGK